MHPLPHTGVLTFVFTDVEGSTSRWERAPETMAQALAAHDRILADVFAAHGGHVFKRVGDAFCCVFTSPRAAAEAAVDAQRQLARQGWDREIAGLRVRFGIHTGSALASDDDYFGPSLNRVARLTAAAHGGQIVLSGATAALLQGDLPPELRKLNLGTHRLRDLAEPETIFQLIAPDLQQDFPALRTLDARPNNLPIELSTFIGRESELRDLRELVATNRLVTVCGPGGIGKTRLALQLAADAIGDFADGVWFVPLTQVVDAALVPQTIASALGIGEIPAESVQATILRELSLRKTLLILDSAEHVLRAVAEVVREILNRSPDVRVLATTREPLHVRGEYVYRLGAIGEPEAVRLFVERARAVVHDFQPAPEDAADLAAIAEALQGIPLAIELAAGRISSLSLPRLRERLGEQLTLLRSASAEDTRHRTLRETISWSHGLLNDAERTLLETLAVFVDGFTLDACEAIAAANRDDTLDVLEALVDKSFVTVRRQGGEARYYLLDAIREYAAADMKQPLLDSVRARHYDVFSALARKGNDALQGDALRAWLDAVGTDIANLRAALTYGFDMRKSEVGDMLGGMWRYWYIRHRIKEGRAWLQRYIENAPREDAKLGGVLRRASAFAGLEGAYDEAEALAKRAVVLYHKEKNETGILEALHALAVNENRRGNYGGAQKLYEDLAVRCSQAGQIRAAVTARANAASLKLKVGELDSAEKLLSDCRAQSESLGDEDVHGTIVALHGTLAYKRKQWDEADHYFRQALVIKTDLKNDFGICEVGTALAAVCVRRNRTEEAAELAAASLQLALDLDELQLTVDALEVCAIVAQDEDDFELAKDAFTLAAALRRRQSYSEKTALGREEVEGELERRFGAGWERAASSRVVGDWKAIAQTIVSRLRNRSEINVT